MSTLYETIHSSSISIAQQITATLRSYWKWWIMYEENERLQKLLDSVDVKPRRRGIESYSARYYNARRVKEEATNVAKKMHKIQRETEEEETLAEKHRIILAEERRHLTMKIIGLATTYVRVKYELPSESEKK